MPKAGEELVYFTLKASGETGIGKIKTTARSSGDSSTENLEIDVRDPNARATNSTMHLVEGGKTLRTEFALVGRPGTNEVVVEASTIPPIDLDYRLGYLIQLRETARARETDL